MSLNPTSIIAPGREGVGTGGRASQSLLSARFGVFSPRCRAVALVVRRGDLGRGLPRMILQLAGASAPALLDGPFRSRQFGKCSCHGAGARNDGRFHEASLSGQDLPDQRVVAPGARRDMRQIPATLIHEARP